MVAFHSLYGWQVVVRTSSEVAGISCYAQVVPVAPSNSTIGYCPVVLAILHNVQLVISDRDRAVSASRLEKWLSALPFGLAVAALILSLWGRCTRYLGGVGTVSDGPVPVMAVEAILGIQLFPWLCRPVRCSFPEQCYRVCQPL